MFFPIYRYELPSILKFITWNYDLQFELSYKEYQNNNIAQIQKQLQILPSRFKADNYDIDLSKFALIHLNGIAGLGGAHELSSSLQGTFLDTIDTTKPLDSLIKYYSSFDDELPNDRTFYQETEFFNYSWEVNPEFEGIHPDALLIRNKAIEIMKSTDVLVVIGYSFPFFNRGVDKLLIRDAKSLKKVYVQDKNAVDIRDQMRNSFESLKLKDIRSDIDIKTQTGVNQFFNAL